MTPVASRPQASPPAATAADLRAAALLWHRIAFAVWPDHRMDGHLPDRLEALARELEGQDTRR